MTSRPRHAFTLIELLVVIAIMAILMSIGLPAIVKASSVASDVKCRANVRSILQATTAYLGDHNNIYPASSSTNDLRFLTLVGGPGISTWALANRPANDRPLYSYLNGAASIAIAECPLDQGSSSIPSTTGATNFEYLGSSYVYPDRWATNLRARNNVWSIEGHRLTRVQQPSKKMVLSDMSLWVDPGPEQNAWHESQDGAQTASMGFVDGHVAIQAAKIDSPAYGNWTQYTTVGYIIPTTAAIEDWAVNDDYY